MNANMPSRSASILAEDPPLVPPAPPKTAIRSLSIGSSFFHKDSSSFFTPDAANTSGNSLDGDVILEEKDGSAPAPDLDIVGALGTLDLDDDFVLSKSQGSNPGPVAPQQEAKNTPKLRTPFAPQQLQFLYGDSGYQHFYQHPYQGLLTPNPSVGNGFPLAFGNSTPLSTWSSTFVPSTAPPFAYSLEAPDLSNLAIKPFELPEEKPGKDAGANPNLHAPFSTPLPLYPFGGVLDSFSSGSVYGYPEGYAVQDASSSESELENGSHEGTKPFSRPFGLAGADYSAEGPDQFGFKDSLSMQNGPNGAENLGLWNQHIRNQPQAPFDSRMGPQNGQYGHMGRFGGRRPFGQGNGMNVHRKMHSNLRRKGDDASKYANAKLEDFSGEMYQLCKDQHGCRFLQRQLDLGREVAAGSKSGVSNDIAATMIFNEIYLKIVELMTDPFGNYLIQKLFENVLTDQRVILVKNAAPEFVRVALDPHGTRALQKLVECISTEEELRLIIELLSPHVVSLSRDLNGNHVVQKCLQKLLASDNQFIFDTASAHCNEIASHRHGCCVLQRCLDHGSLQQRTQLLARVAENATNLLLDPFGNYVVQYVLLRGDDRSIAVILEHIRANVILLSLHKFGSNVIEKSLRIAKLTDTLVEVLLANKEHFGELLNDAFGNYVLQTSLDVANAADLAKLSPALQPLLSSIKNTPHGRRIMTKIQSIL